MLNLLDVVGTETSAITSIAYKLKRMAVSFYETGNETVAERLEMIGDHLEVSSSNISRALGKSLSDEVQKANERMGNLLVAALAGATTVSDDEDTKKLASDLADAIDKGE